MQRGRSFSSSYCLRHRCSTVIDFHLEGVTDLPKRHPLHSPRTLCLAKESKVARISGKCVLSGVCVGEWNDLVDLFFFLITVLV